MNSNMSAQELSDLLGLDLELMRKGLCLRHSRSGRGSLTSVNLSPAIAKTGLDALIKVSERSERALMKTISYEPASEAS